jgi:hypothetical protein
LAGSRADPTIQRRCTCIGSQPNFNGFRITFCATVSDASHVQAKGIALNAAAVLAGALATLALFGGDRLRGTSFGTPAPLPAHDGPASGRAGAERLESNPQAEARVALAVSERYVRAGDLANAAVYAQVAIAKDPTLSAAREILATTAAAGVTPAASPINLVAAQATVSAIR